MLGETYDSRMELYSLCGLLHSGYLLKGELWRYLDDLNEQAQNSGFESSSNLPVDKVIKRI